MTTAKEYFVLTLPLITEPWQEDILKKRFEVNCRIYNALLKEGEKRLKQMWQTRRYRELAERLKTEKDTAARKACYQEMNTLIEQYGLRKYDFTKEAAKYRVYFKENTDSPVVQNLAGEVWKVISARIWKEQTGVRYKNADTFSSVSGKTNKASIMFRTDRIIWKGLSLPVDFRKGSTFETEALKREIRYCRIKRREIRGEQRYYVDLIMKGSCPVKRELLGQEGTVGVDVGISQVAVATRQFAGIYPLYQENAQYVQQKRELLQKMERSRRKTNADNYDADGRIRQGTLTWNYSGNYQKLQSAFKELCRREAVKKREYYQELAEELLPLGNTFIVENLDFRKIAQSYRGRKIEYAAPATFLELLETKVRKSGGTFYRVDPAKICAASYNHLTGCSEKIPPGVMERNIGGRSIHKYMYSAFLLMNVIPEEEKIDCRKCSDTYEEFLKILP